MSFTLVDLDNSLRAINKKELIYLYVMIVGGSIFVSYYFLFEKSEKSLADAINNEKQISRDIRNHKDYLSFHDDFEITKLKGDIVNLKKSIDDFREKKNFINGQIKSLSDIIYNRESWTDFLNNISDIAKESGVEIDSIKNTFLSFKRGEFNKHLKIDLKINSNYINTLKFMDKLERNKLIVDIDSLDMLLTDDGVNTTLSLSLWG
jgi:Tfp pilus assembly protein PilO